MWLDNVKDRTRLSDDDFLVLIPNRTQWQRVVPEAYVRAPQRLSQARDG